MEASVQSKVLFDIPREVMDQIAYDPEQDIWYVEKKTAGNPLFLTWQERHEWKGVNLNIQICDAEVIAKLRETGLGAKEPNRDQSLENRERAIELLLLAAQYKASDIHLLIKGRYAEIQIEVDGALKILRSLTTKEADVLTQAIYQGLSANRDVQLSPLDFQNAMISGSVFPTGSIIASARIIRGPCYPQHEGGSFLTIRLHYTADNQPITQNLPVLKPPRAPEGDCLWQGYTASQVHKIKLLASMPSGAVFISGPTGSGKTHTIFEFLKYRAQTTPHQRQVGVEDPVEKQMPWMVQLSVNDTRDDLETGKAFADRIRVMLRMAPKHLFVGEIRGPAAATAVIEAAITGHTVISSLHMTDPFLFVKRLENMDPTRLRPETLCDHHIICGSIAQRLVSHVCPHCSTLLIDNMQAVPARMIEALRTWGEIDQIRLQGPGCEQCGGKGTQGRSAIAEIVVTDATLMLDLLQHGSETARKNYRARADADPSMLETGIDRVLAGIVDPRALEETVALITARQVSA